MLSKTHTKDIQLLHHKKFRDEYRLFIAEGPKLVMDLLAGGKFICKELLASGKWLHEHPAIITGDHGTVITEVEDFELEKISALSTPNQVLAVFEMTAEKVISAARGKITLVLDTIQDPGNMGTIIRIADWFGVTAIICSMGCADRYNPKVVQSTMGSLGRVEMGYTDIPEWLEKNKDLPVFAAALDGKPVQQLKKTGEGIFIIGNESRGISEEVMERVNEKITIPKIGMAESLNAAVATGIILSHIC
jgi:TrmH family RNA methyltransferase